MHPLTDAEIVEHGEREGFYRRLKQRAALLASGWTEAEVYEYVTRNVAPERETKAGEDQWERGARENFAAWERRRERARFEERVTGRVRPSRNGGRFQATLQRHSRSTPTRSNVRLQPRQRERQPRSRTARATASGTDPPPPSGHSDLTPIQRGHLLLLEALVTTSRDGLESFLAFLDLAAIRIAAEITRLGDWSDR